MPDGAPPVVRPDRPGRRSGTAPARPPVVAAADGTHHGRAASRPGLSGAGGRRTPGVSQAAARRANSVAR